MTISAASIGYARTHRRLPAREIVQVLESHGIQHRDNGAGLEALEDYYSDGEHFQDWRSVDGFTRAELMSWLGY